MIKFEIPSDKPKLIAAIGLALMNYTGESRHASKLAALATGDSTCAPVLPDDHNEQLSEQEIKAGLKDGTVEVTEKDVKIAESLFAPNLDVTRDPKGVPKNDQFCATAQDPYYKAGNPRADQWKRKTGVTQEAYDEWYAAELLLVPNPNGPGPQTNTIDTQAALTGNPSSNEPPVELGGLMRWITEQAEAGRLKQTEIDLAWGLCSLRVEDMYPPVSDIQIKINVHRIYTHLSNLASAR